jgi:hypothetical protein
MMPPPESRHVMRHGGIAMHPVIIASGLLSASILGAAFGPRLLPEPVAAAPAAQFCKGEVGFYAAGTDEIIEYGNGLAAFQKEIVAPRLDDGTDFQILDFEEIGGQVVVYYVTGC